jgi:NitT/TauT family transport system substrate-binding protein
VGIEFPDGSVMGDSGNIKLRFDDRYMKMAAEGEL